MTQRKVDERINLHSFQASFGKAEKKMKIEEDRNYK